MLLTVFLLRTTVGSSTDAYWENAIRLKNSVQYFTCSFKKNYGAILTSTSKFRLVTATKVQ
jgi:hypothetical protein